MATLSFNQVGDVYQAEFTANSDYALHIERKKVGKLKILQKSITNGSYADCILPTWVSNCGQVLDCTISHGMYPMHVLIVSETPVTIAERQEAQ